MPRRLLNHWKTLAVSVALLLGGLFGTAELIHWQRGITCAEVGKIMSMEAQYSRPAAGCYIKTPQGWRNVQTLYYMDPFK